MEITVLEEPSTNLVQSRKPKELVGINIIQSEPLTTVAIVVSKHNQGQLQVAPGLGWLTVVMLMPTGDPALHPRGKGQAHFWRDMGIRR